MTYERDAIRRMSGYTPGEQPASTDAIKLNTNENPYPPPQAVMRALGDITAESLRRYPSPSARAFRQAAARLHDLQEDEVVATNGGDELLRLAITTFVKPGQPIGVAEPSYSLYPVLAAVNASPVIRIPLDDQWRPASDFARRLNAEGAELAFLVNPHAPSGTLLTADDIATIAGEFDGVLVIDEAYVDFVDEERSHDVLHLIRDHDNLLVLRTLSKGYSLAGLRLGYGIGADSLIGPIATKTRDSYSVDAVAQILGATALDRRDVAAVTWRRIRSERVRLAQELRDLGMYCPPSQANFLLANVPGSVTGGARGLHERLKARQIFVRHFDQDRLRSALRITVGTPDQNDRLLRVMAELQGA